MINLQNNKGMTPLHLACSNGHDQVAEYLLTQGATIEKYVCPGGGGGGGVVLIKKKNG